MADVVDFVGDKNDGLLSRAQHTHNAFVGGGCPHHRVDDKKNGVGKVNGDFGLLCNGKIDAPGVGLPTAGVDKREPAIVPLGLVGNAVAGYAGNVLDDCFATPENSVDQRRLADVGSTDNRQHRQRGQNDDLVGVSELRFQYGDIVVVEVVFLESAAQRIGTLDCVGVGHPLQSLDNVIGSKIV